MDGVESEGLILHVETAPKLNFACHQSAFPVLRALSAENQGSGVPLDDVTVTVTATPPFFRDAVWTIDRIGPGTSVAVKTPDVEIDGQFLLNLADAVRGTLTIRAERAGVCLTETTHPIELLAYNEWGGAGYMPEQLAAFSVPNDPVVDRVLGNAAEVLRHAGRPSGIDGYQSGRRERVWEIAAAIYTAIANLGLNYAMPPASFERDGQKIRLPGHIMDSGLGTCLDLTMLFCSVLEQAGLNPVVVLPQGHALIGVWLQPEQLSTIVIDEAEPLRKRVALKELLLFETTYVTANPPPPFTRAIEAAGDRVLPERDETFGAAVDIRRARAFRIAPLGLKSGDADQVKAAAPAAPSVSLGLEAPPPLPGFDAAPEAPVQDDTPAGRLERWHRRLLDLSVRNPMLHHRASTTSLSLICPDPGLLEDKLAANARIAVQPVPQRSAPGQDADLHRQRTGEAITQEYAADALERNQVLVDLPEAELSRRLIEIYRRTRTALQEGGANTLFLALGFLLWKRDDKDERRFRAPLILMPVALDRTSVRSGVRLTAHDDEPRFNTTLLEMLRKDFDIHIGGLDGPLPEDHSGIDVAGIWTRVRHAIKDAPGFEVVEDVVLGHFSFAKYLMWKDLVDRTDALRRNAVVQHLIDTPRDPFPSDIRFVDGAQVDRLYTPSDLLAPLPADSSQMAAIATADRGKNFVIIGPPGTGKSQTIANMIAHLLGSGKSVLFVSEKAAALEVVHRRLEHIGLGPFCLQLHSNKARKADVLRQLGEAWTGGQPHNAATWQREAARLRTLRDRLNQVVDHLHARHRNGLTPHHAIGVSIRDAALAAQVSVRWPRADTHDEATLEGMREAVEALAVQSGAVRDLSASPLQGVLGGDWSPQWETHLVEGAEALMQTARDLRAACAAFANAAGFDCPTLTPGRLDALLDLARVLRESHRRQTAYAFGPDGAERLEALDQAVTHLRAYLAAQRDLSVPFDPMAWRELDGEALARRWAAARETWWPRRVFLKGRIRKEMRRDGNTAGKPDPERDAPVLARLRRHGEAIDRLGPILEAVKGWRAHDSAADDMERLRDLGQRARHAAGRLADDATALTTLRARLRDLLNEGNDLLADDAPVGVAARSLDQAMDAYREAHRAFDRQRGAPAAGDDAAAALDLDAVADMAAGIAGARAELREWCAWRRRRAQAIDLDLMPMVEALEAGRIDPTQARDVFEAAYCTWWAAAIIGEDEVLRTFSTAEHEASIRKFREVDETFQALTAEYVVARLRGDMPDQETVTRGSQWGILNRELQKKARHKPVRQLVQEIPEALGTLAPCLMMSPLSVAQYLPAEQAPFDVVIFDEASQITVWDAVGAIARGRQLIVAGDPKQMPPTTFFDRSDDDIDGDIETDVTLESILDEMRGASIPERVLSLHYRSRRESLIAFSNSRYYEDQLVTFPAPAVRDHGVTLVRTEGHYARGKARHNEGEARAVVDEVVGRLTHPDKAVRRLSIGVVTFNSEQQTLIENLLDEARARHPEIEWAFAADGLEEPVFVKNLETVQGDERDVILFSITYGPDQSGHMTMNFGPLNKQGGERRLNVALTRARFEMRVFSSLPPERIDLSRTQARAVTDLKHFLEFAERGPSALGRAVFGSVGDVESPFESAVLRALRERGWEVHPQIGVSRYRVDLGVVHPDAPGTYLAGIECDGAMYHSAANARERDKIRQAVLEALGWTLFRIWSADWWHHADAALAAVDAALRAHLEADRARQAEAEAARAEAEAQAMAEADARSDADATAASETGGASDTDAAAPVETGSTDPAETQGAARNADLFGDVGPLDAPAAPRPLAAADRSPADGDTTAGSEDSPAPPPGAGPLDVARAYVVSSFEAPDLAADPEAFYDDAYDVRLVAMVRHVVDTEGPIHEDILIRRIARHHGFKRAGRLIRERVLEVAGDQAARTTEDVGAFYWAKAPEQMHPAPARCQGRDDDVRSVDHICAAELRSINTDLDLMGDPVAVARAIGLTRLSQSARERLERVLA